MPKSVTELEQELNQALQDQKVLEAFEQFYAEDVIMQENSGESCSGKAANRPKNAGMGRDGLAVPCRATDRRRGFRRSRILGMGIRRDL